MILLSQRCMHICVWRAPVLRARWRVRYDRQQVRAKSQRTWGSFQRWTSDSVWVRFEWLTSNFAKKAILQLMKTATLAIFVFHIAGV